MRISAISRRFCPSISVPAQSVFSPALVEREKTRGGRNIRAHGARIPDFIQHIKRNVSETNVPLRFPASTAAYDSA